MVTLEERKKPWWWPKPVLSRWLERVGEWTWEGGFAEEMSSDLWTVCQQGRSAGRPLLWEGGFGQSRDAVRSRCCGLGGKKAHGTCRRGGGKLSLGCYD